MKNDRAVPPLCFLEIKLADGKGGPVKLSLDTLDHGYREVVLAGDQSWSIAVNGAAHISRTWQHDMSVQDIQRLNTQPGPIASHWNCDQCGDSAWMPKGQTPIGWRVQNGIDKCQKCADGVTAFVEKQRHAPLE